jgi:hypothetical protein
MRRSWRPLVVATTAVLLLTMVAAGSGLAHSRNTITAINELSFEPNKALNVGFRFKPGTLRIGHGEKLTFQEGPATPEAAGQEAHTLSIVARSDVPRTIEEVLTCEACGPILTAHDPDNNGEPPFNPVVNVGKPGLDQPGDSILITPEDPVIKARVTAPAGSRLRFICAIHPWMQGKLIVE